MTKSDQTSILYQLSKQDWGGWFVWWEGSFQQWIDVPRKQQGERTWCSCFGHRKPPDHWEPVDFTTRSTPFCAVMRKKVYGSFLFVEDSNWYVLSQHVCPISAFTQTGMSYFKLVCPVSACLIDLLKHQLQEDGQNFIFKQNGSSSSLALRCACLFFLNTNQWIGRGGKKKTTHM